MLFLFRNSMEGELARLLAQEAGSRGDLVGDLELSIYIHVCVPVPRLLSPYLLCHRSGGARLLTRPRIP